MISVADVARELDRPQSDVLAACGDLDIVASSAASGLSSAEHRRLRAHFGGDDAVLGAVPRGSTDSDPGSSESAADAALGTWDTLLAERHAPPAADSVRLPFHKRVSARTVVRGTVLLFGVVAIGAALFGLNERGTDPVDRCVDFTADQATRSVPCAEPHDAEIVARFSLDDDPSTPHPGQASLVADAAERCPDPADLQTDATDALAAVYLVPTPSRWDAGDRTVLCLVEDPTAPLVGSIAP